MRGRGRFRTYEVAKRIKKVLGAHVSLYLADTCCTLGVYSSRAVCVKYTMDLTHNTKNI